MLRFKDELLKERESLLRTLQSQDCSSVTLARRNQAQKAKLKNKEEIIKMRDREIAILRETMKNETESEDEAENSNGVGGSSKAS